MGQGRFEIEEELVVDSVDLRQSRIRPRSRDNWLTQKGRALGLGGTESGLGGAGTGRGGAGEPSQAGSGLPSSAALQLSGSPAVSLLNACLEFLWRMVGCLSHFL